MDIGSTVIPSNDIEKGAAAPLALLPLGLKIGFGTLSGLGMYQGAKDIAHGNIGRGAFTLATSLPFIGFAGKGLRALGLVGRGIAKGGRIGNLGRLAKSWGRAAKQTRALELYNPKNQVWARNLPFGDPSKPGFFSRVGDAYRWLGSGPARVPGRPTGVAGGLDWASRRVFSLGSRVSRFGDAVRGTRYGRFMTSWPGIFGGMAAHSLLFPERSPVTGHPEAISDYGPYIHALSPGRTDQYYAPQWGDWGGGYGDYGGYTPQPAPQPSIYGYSFMDKESSDAGVANMDDYKTQVKKAFFRTLSRNGVSPDDYLSSDPGKELIKTAVHARELNSSLEKKGDVINNAFELLIRALKTNDPWAKAVAAGALGTATGYGGGKIFGFATSPSMSSVDNLRKKELIAEYDSAIDELNHRIESRTHR